MKTIKQALDEQNNDYSHLEKEYLKLTGSSLSIDPVSPPPQQVKAKPLTATIVIPAWNVRNTILACLASIEQSSFNISHQNRLQVVIVDDGSTDDTWDIIKKSDFSLHLTAIRQNHHSVAKARNTGFSMAEGNIIISCDADMVLSYYTIENLIVRHQYLQDVLLVGFRSNVPENDPQVNPDFIRKCGNPRDSYFIGDERIAFQIPGYPSNMCLASNHLKQLGCARSLWMPDYDIWDLPNLVFGVLFSVPRHIYSSIGGYDERFYGWGHEDGYFAAKVIAEGLYIIPVYSASGLHIIHSPRSKDKELEYIRNRKKYFRLLRTCKAGQYPNWLAQAKDRIKESIVFNPTPIPSGANLKEVIYQKNKSVLNKTDGLLAVGEYSQAFETLKKNKKIIKENEYLLRLGNTFFGMNRYQEAISVFEDVSASMNFAAKPTIELARAQAANGQFKSAKEIVRKLSQAHPQARGLSYWYYCSAQRHITQGRRYLNQKFYQVALRCFEAALIAEPNNRVALKYRSECMVSGK